MDGAGAWSESARGITGDNRILNRMMLRYRPIAPKPVTGAAGGSILGAAEAQGSPSNKASLPVKRAKRKYVRVRRNNTVNARKNSNGDSREKLEEGGDDVAVVTLPLMPEKEERERSSLAGDSWCKNVDLDLTVEKIQILDNQNPPANAGSGKGSDPSAAAAAVVESWVTVESVTGTCMGEGGLGCTGVEKVKVLEGDTCPGFVSDGYFRVRWLNDAFKRMVVSEGDGVWPEVVVWLKVKDNAVWCCYSYPAFTCGVRLQYTWRNGKCTKMVPCDVWRLECGGFAWRLDVKAALSLGL